MNRSHYDTELERLGDTYRQAISADIEPVKAAIAGASESSIIGVGSGGSFTVASLLCSLHEHYTGRVSRPSTPLEIICNPTLASVSPVFLISAEGKNPDITEALQRARMHSARPVHVLTNREHSPLAECSSELTDISLHISERIVTAFIGPSGCGKSTLLRCFNRMNDLIDHVRIEGTTRIGGHDIYSSKVDVIELRKRVGMVFQKSNPFPKSIYDNIAYGLRLHGVKSKSEVDAVVEQSLHNAALWDEVKDRLHASALGLSGGQQQRLCIARAIAIKPEIILMDEPASALDPIATSRIEDLILNLKKDFTIVIVTHNMQQAARVSNRCAFFLAEHGTPGYIVEHGPTDAMFNSPQDPRTADYVNGRFG